jgi:phospholipid/cholesterol/gamma-HCH transport system substrate-binding protein
METRANHALIGLFTLAVLSAAFGFVYWFKAANSTGERQSYRLVFQGSVSGLSRGSVVRFNGISVGEVTNIELVPEDPRLVAATISVNPKLPIKADTRARLEYQGLTGVAAIQLTGGSPNAPLLATPDGTGRATLFADRSDFQDILETVQRLAGRVDGVIAKVEKVISDNDDSIGRTVRNVETFSRALSDNAAGISSFLASVGDTAQRISAVSTRIDKLALDLDDIVRSIDTKSVGRLVSNLDAFGQTLVDNRQNVSSIMSDAASLTKRLNDTSVKLDTALVEFSRLAQALDGERINGVVRNVDKFAQVLGDQAGQVTITLDNAAELSGKLNKSAEKVDRVLSAAENFLGTGGGASGAQNMFTEITEAAKSFRALSGVLEKRIGELTGGITRFTASGTRDLQAVATDARNSLNQLNRTIRSVEQNPQQFLFGQRAPIPEYRGSR